MKHEKKVYEGFTPFEHDRDTGVTCRKISVVKTRSLHDCVGSADSHVIEAGEMARCEKARMNGLWYTTYMCTNCIDKILAEGY